MSSEGMSPGVANVATSKKTMSTVSIICIGMAEPAMSIGRRLPYTSYLPSQTSSVFICESEWGSVQVRDKSKKAMAKKTGQKKMDEANTITPSG